MTVPQNILIEGYSVQDFLAFTDEQIDVFVFTNEPIVFQIGSAQILGTFSRTNTRLTLELAQIDGGGEGVLPTLWHLSERYAKLHRLTEIEWIVHAVNCAKPNTKLRRVLELRGFVVQHLANIGEVYYLLHHLH
jgi:hypothetical protein